MAQSYLKVDRIISAAELGNVVRFIRIRFLSENLHFAEICRACGLVYRSDCRTMELLGDKNMAQYRQTGRRSGVPGGDGLIDSEGRRLPWPSGSVIGPGQSLGHWRGRGMRVV